MVIVQCTFSDFQDLVSSKQVVLCMSGSVAIIGISERSES